MIELERKNNMSNPLSTRGSIIDGIFSICGVLLSPKNLPKTESGKKYICEHEGHRPSGVITGFRNMDGAVISRCKFCDIPIVCKEWFAAPPLHKTLYPDEPISTAEYLVKEKSERI